MADNENYYDLLKVHPQASAQEIRKAYRRLVNKYRYGRLSDDAGAAEMVQRLDAASEVLSDPEKRAAYDRERSFSGHIDNQQAPEQPASELVPIREQAPARIEIEPTKPASPAPQQAETPPEEPDEDDHYALRPRLDEAELAGFSRRCGALLLDYILTLFIPALMLVLAVFIKRRMESPAFADALVLIGYLAAATVLLFNLIYSYVQYGQSFGKRFMGLRVVRTDGRPLDYQTAALRHLVGYPLSFLVLGLGLLWMFWDARQQCWHDKLAKTVVIKE